ncbi:MAG: response regulator [Gammaproteobacteria bacterium]|nr:response regulator [Gammaproteobacteria bacterium]
MAEDQAGRIRLLVTDLVMPEMNGRDLADQVREACPDVRVIFMSGYTADVIGHHGVLDEGVAFVQKPFDGQDLTSKIREVLDRRSPRSAGSGTVRRPGTLTSCSAAPAAVRRRGAAATLGAPECPTSQVYYGKSQVVIPT